MLVKFLSEFISVKSLNVHLYVLDVRSAILYLFCDVSVVYGPLSQIDIHLMLRSKKQKRKRKI